MNKKIAYLLGVAAGALGLHGAGIASETVTYTYDALGRLVATSSSGTVNDGIVTAVSYDAAGNRSSYVVDGAGGGGGTPPPPPPNQPPVANSDDGGSMDVCTSISVNVVANDTDPEGNYPLSLVGIHSIVPAYGSAYAESSTNVRFTAGATPGGVQVTYIVQDSLGATSHGILGVYILPGDCW